MPENADGLRQAASFYYFTGLTNVIGAVLALDAPRHESWLFVPDSGTLAGGFMNLFHAPYGYVESGPATAMALGIDHVVPWTEIDAFLARRLAEDSTLVLRGPFRPDTGSGGLLPTVAAGQSDAAMWQRALHERFPRARFGSARAAVSLRAVKDSTEIAILRRVAESSAAALRAGLASLRPGRHQRVAEIDVLTACVESGAEGISFWPWIMTGPNSGIMQAIQSLADARFLDRAMREGELARVDVGCARENYEGDVGRTAPVSGQFEPGQREAWELLVAAYRAGLAAIGPGRTTREVLGVFRGEIERRRPSLRTAFGKRTADVALGPGGLEWAELHGVGIEAAEFLGDTLRAGNVLAFEPILTVDGVGLYLEDMILVTDTGAEVLTKGLPYSADEIERAVRARGVRH
jgi:Xaa-Pro aminopeptidase